jgi:muconolactone delta-isomerase
MRERQILSSSEVETMEFLVTMTTHVPDGTSEEKVQEVRSREAARSGELAAERQLLRLWRPPLRPGEWRSLGLFAAEDSVELEEVLSSMPLRVWRTDEVMPLSRHANDPGAASANPVRPLAEAVEFLTIFTVAVPSATPAETVEETEAAEAARAKELAAHGHLERLWVLPGQGRALGLWRARDTAEMEAIVKSLPLDPWMTTEITPLTPHPSDPGVTGS